MSSKMKIVFNLSVVVLSFIGVYYLQFNFDQLRIKHIKSFKISTNELLEPAIPSEDSIKKLTFGQNTLIADLLWLQTIQYYGSGDPYGKYRQLPKLINAITTIDPKFTYPYSFAGLILPNEGFVDEALEILSNGEQNLPQNWEIPYSKGTILYINKKDYKSAAASYSNASNKPGAPDKTKFLSAVQYDRGENYQTAMQIFQNLADKSDNQYFKDRAKLFVDHYLLLDSLEKVCKTFKDKEGRYPRTLNELVQKKVVNEIPADPLGREIKYDSGTGKVNANLEKK